MCSRADVDSNISTAERLTQQAINAGAHWIVLPEMFMYMGETQGLLAAAQRSSEAISRLQDLANKFKVTIFAGSVPEFKPQSQKVLNRLYVLSSSVERVHYDKLHLFHLQDPHGDVLYSEHDAYLQGEELKTVCVDGWELGLGICYDLRFSDMFNALSRQKPIDGLILPSAFTQKTGAHWELLLRARAVEWQCYVLGANQFGGHSSTKQSFGHSMIVGPWGQVLVNTGAQESIVLTELDPECVYQTKFAIPVHRDRRPEVYS